MGKEEQFTIDTSGMMEWIRAQAKKWVDNFPKLADPGRRDLVDATLVELWLLIKLREMLEHGQVDTVSKLRTFTSQYTKVLNSYSMNLTRLGLVKSSKYEPMGDSAKRNAIPTPGELAKQLGMNQDEE